MGAKIVPMKTLASFGTEIQAIEFGPGGRSLIVAGADGEILVWDPVTDRRLSTLGRSGGVREVRDVLRLLDDRTLLATGQQFTGVEIWDLATGEIVERFEGFGPADVSPDGRFVAYRAPRPGWIEVRDLRERTLIGRFDVLEAHPEGLEDLALTPDGSQVLTAAWVLPFIGYEYSYTEDPCQDVLRWSVADGRPLPPLVGHTDDLSRIAVSPRGDTAISCGKGGQVRIWDLSRAACTAERTRGGPWTYAIDYSPNGFLVAFGGLTDKLQILEARSGEEWDAVPDHEDGVSCLRFHREGWILATGTKSGIVRLWSVKGAAP